MERTRFLLNHCVQYSLRNRVVNTKVPQSSQIITSRAASRTVASETEMDLSAQHNSQKKEFFIQLTGNDGKANKALLEYEWVKEDVVDLYHTEVPPVFRGKGVAKILAKAAMDFVVDKDVKMILSCTYLQKYVKDNPLPEYTSRTLPLT